MRAALLLFVGTAVVALGAPELEGRRSAKRADGDSVLALTSGGWVAGARRPALYGRHYYSFRGVPYARPPLGRLRFQEPRPAERWAGVLDAREEGPACPQHDPLYGPLLRPRTHNESCLYANVHVPAGAGHAADGALRCEGPPRPVLVFVHGGGFAYGSGDADRHVHGPEPLVTEDIVVVTFNYRLGAFGFVSAGGAAGAGLVANAGLRDVVALLRWVRDNASTFCADAGRVTLGGQSAGAALVHFLTLTNETMGLFHRAILMSGAATRSFFTSSPLNADRMFGKLSARLGLADESADESAGRVGERLRALPADRLVRETAALQDEEGLVTFVPVAEAGRGAGGVAPLVPSDPEAEALRREGGAHVPLIIGFTAFEGNTFRRRFDDLDIVNVSAVNPLVMVPPSLLYRLSADRAAAAGAAAARRYYDADAGPSLEGFVRFASEAYFEYPALKAAQWAAARGGPVYLYRFSYESEARLLQAATGREWRGAGHIQDLLSVFRTGTFPGPPPASADAWMRDLMVRLFADFIATGEPAPGWPKVSGGGGAPADDLRYLDIDLHTRLSTLTPRQTDMLRFYDGLYELAAPAQPSR